MNKYTIEKGRHYSLHLPKLYIGKKRVKIKYMFPDECRYLLPGVDQDDINKLAGHSYGYHKKNSIRVGWNYEPTTDKIDLFAYRYEGGVRKYDKIGECDLNEYGEIDLDHLDYSFSMTGNDIKGGRKYFEFKYPLIKIGYYNYPYFGGEPYPAPHKMYIYMEMV